MNTILAIFYSFNLAFCPVYYYGDIQAKNANVITTEFGIDLFEHCKIYGGFSSIQKPINWYNYQPMNQKYKIGIVSNCLEGYIEIFLKKYNYGKYFIDYANAANGNSKAENIKMIVEKHNLKTPVYVGDTPKDLESALEAKVEFIYASYGFQDVKWDKKIKALDELLDL